MPSRSLREKAAPVQCSRIIQDGLLNVSITMDAVSLAAQELGRGCMAAIWSGVVKIFTKTGENVFPRIHLVWQALFF